MQTPKLSPPLIALLLAIALFFAGGLLQPNFVSIDQAVNILRLAAFLGIIAAGQTLVIISGGEGIDLSVGAIVTLSAILVYRSVNGDNALIGPALLLALGAGAAIGLVNGLGITALRIPPLVMTLSMTGIVQGAILVVTQGQLVGKAAPAMGDFISKLGCPGEPRSAWRELHGRGADCQPAVADKAARCSAMPRCTRSPLSSPQINVSASMEPGISSRIIPAALVNKSPLYGRVTGTSQFTVGSTWRPSTRKVPGAIVTSTAMVTPCPRTGSNCQPRRLTGAAPALANSIHSQRLSSPAWGSIITSFKMIFGQGVTVPGGSTRVVATGVLVAGTVGVPGLGVFVTVGVFAGVAVLVAVAVRVGTGVRVAVGVVVGAGVGGGGLGWPGEPKSLWTSVHGWPERAQPEDDCGSSRTSDAPAALPRGRAQATRSANAPSARERTSSPAWFAS
jgi:hypothetical protein